MIHKDYFDHAKDHEALFRSILRDMQSNTYMGKLGIHIPPDFNPESPLEKLFDDYSQGTYGRFQIYDFKRIDEDSAHISVGHQAILAGKGATLVYKTLDDAVEFLEPTQIWRS